MTASDVDRLLDVAAWVLIGLVAFNWLAAWALHRIDRAHPGIAALRERVVAQFVLALSATLFGWLGFNRIFAFDLDHLLVIALLVTGAVLVSVPGLVWLWRAWRNDW